LVRHARARAVPRGGTGKWIETPEGWAQANLLLATLREPPPRGSLQSYVLQALLIRKDQIEYMRTRAVVQALVNKDEAQKALDAYRDAQMPYLQGVQKNDRQQHIKRLMDEVAKGAISVTPIMPKQVRSRLKTRVVQRTTEEQLAQSRRLSKQMGGLL